MTVQFRVASIEEGIEWYKILLDKHPDVVPHDGFAEWELIPGCWLQVAEGNVIKGNGPLRLGVRDILRERNRMIEKLNIPPFEIHSRSEVPVKWATFQDPWGNEIGFFEYLNKQEEINRVKEILNHDN